MLNLITIFKSPKGFLSSLMLACISTICYAQTDTLYTGNQKIACNIKEITPDAVKYAFPGEDLLNSVYKNSVQKIVFKSGRVQTFAEATSYKTVADVRDFENVTITSVESEIKGLYKVGDVNAKAKGTTVYSNQERVKERAYHKLKIQAAMFGANTIYLTAIRTEGNKYGGYFTSGSSAETNLTGVAYNNVLPNFDKFKRKIGDRVDFVATTRYKLWASDSDVSTDISDKKIKIIDIVNENGLVMIEADLQGESGIHRFQLANFNDQNFSIAYKDKGTAYNFVFSF